MTLTECFDHRNVLFPGNLYLGFTSSGFPTLLCDLGNLTRLHHIHETFYALCPTKIIRQIVLVNYIFFNIVHSYTVNHFDDAASVNGLPTQISRDGSSHS